MNTDPLDRAVREHYRRAVPPEAVLRRLRDATAAADRAQRRRWRAPLAAAAVLALAAVWLWLGTQGDNLATRVAAEVVMNHRKELGFDFASTDYGDLARRMSKLEFRLVDPRPAHAASLRLAGGRYCSIQGALAAQLRLEAPGGTHATLYQTRLATPLAALGSRTVEHEGAEVRLWSSGGVFFALVRDGT